MARVRRASGAGAGSTLHRVPPRSSRKLARSSLERPGLSLRTSRLAPNPNFARRGDRERPVPAVLVPGTPWRRSAEPAPPRAPLGGGSRMNRRKDQCDLPRRRCRRTSSRRLVRPSLVRDRSRGPHREGPSKLCWSLHVLVQFSGLFPTIENSATGRRRTYGSLQRPGRCARNRDRTFEVTRST